MKKGNRYKEKGKKGQDKEKGGRKMKEREEKQKGNRYKEEKEGTREREKRQQNKGKRRETEKTEVEVLIYTQAVHTHAQYSYPGYPKVESKLEKKK